MRVYLMAGPKAKTIRAWGAGWRAESVLVAYAKSLALGRAWFLVEAESSDAARRVIAASGACDCGQPDARPGDLTTSHLEGCASYGRILASGGAR